MKKLSRVLLALAVGVAALLVGVQSSEAVTTVNNPPWRPGRGVMSAVSGGLYRACTAGPWVKDSGVSFPDSYYMVLPSHCVYSSPGNTTPMSDAVKYYKIEPAGATNDSFDSTSVSSFVKPSGAFANYDLVLVKSSLAQNAHTYEMADYRTVGNDVGAGPWMDGTERSTTYAAILRTVFKTTFEDTSTPVGYHACKTGVRGGTDCGLVYGGNTNFEIVGGSANWVTPTMQIDLADDSHGEGCFSADGDSGSPVWIPPDDVSLNVDGKTPLLGMLLGTDGGINNTDTRCYSATTNVGDDIRVVSMATIIAAFPSLGLSVVAPGDSTFAPYPNNTTLAIGNRAIAGTTYSVSCWQQFATGFGKGISVLNCYRYDQWGNPLSHDQYNLPPYCSTVAWMPGTSILAISNNEYYNGEEAYPHIGWNGDAGGCYRGNDQNGSSAFYHESTRFTPTCQPANTSGCSIVNNGYSGGSWWNSPGVSRDVYSGYGGELWPDGRGVYTRVIYTQ